MNTLYVRCQTKDYILDIVAARAGMRINKDNSDINSVHVIKFLGKSSHLNKQSDFSPYLSPESDIYNIFLGDSSTIKFIDKCNIEESVLNVCDLHHLR